jgi:gliding motility-associated-like protein
VKTDGVDTDSDGIDDSCDDFADPIEPEIPEAFTPNGNNINEYFVIGNLENFEQRQLNIYNRYGNSVYSSDNYQNDWDGTRSDNGQALPDATYYYVLKLSENDIRKGFVYINRVRQ